MAANEFYYAIDGEQGPAPVTAGQLMQLAAAGRLKPTDMVWTEGMPDWVTAGSIKGLFANCAPASSTRPAPASGVEEVFEVGPEALVDDDRPPRRRAKPGGGGATLLVRAFAWDLSAADVTPGEQRQLLGQGLPGETVQRYLAWRRSFLLAATLPTLLAAALQTAAALDAFEALNVLGVILECLVLVSLFGLFAAALAGALLWARPSLSRLLVFAGWGVAVFLPVLALLTPGNWVSPTGGVGGGVFPFQALPALAALGPGLIRAGLRLKRLLPGALPPGWVLVTAVPLAMLVLFVAAVLAYQPMPLFFRLALVLVVLAPAVYLARYRLFLHPLTRDDAGSITRLQWIAFGILTLGGVLLAIAILADGPGGMGTRILLALGAYADYLGHSLVTTVVAADFLLGATVLAWRDQQRFARTAEGTEYDRALGELDALAAHKDTAG
jgi:hypothetical protein